jgi:D-3-phosphoglycerate dehydrogenase
MTRPKIIGTGPLLAPLPEILESFGEIIVTPDESQESLLPLLDDAIGVILRGDGTFTEEALHAASNLQVIGRTGVGYDKVCVTAATERGIPVVITPGASARAVAEAAMAWVLALCKRIVHWDQQVKAGNWNCRYENENRDMEAATLGIVGFGRIGQQLAHLAAPFDMTVVAFDPYVSSEMASEFNVTMVSLEELMRRSDYICLHAASTVENRGLINRDVLAHVKPGAFLVNLARGALIEDLDVLSEALEDGRLGGVALDVFEPEPPDVNHPLFRHPNCLTAPHSLGGTPRATYRVYKSLADDMAAAFRGERPKHVVNPEVFE